MTMRSLALMLFGATAVMSLAEEAHAQEKYPKGGAPFGTRAENVIVIDEFVGFYRETVYSPDANNTDESGFIRVGSHGGAYALNETVRFGYHRFLTPDLSFGGGLHFSERDASLGGAEVGLSAKQTTLGISPRVGFVFSASDSGAFWLRVGFQYYHYSLDNDVSAWDFGPGAELFYVITPFEHFGITLGPTVELQLAGNIHQPGSKFSPGRDEALRRRTFGFALGFLFDL